MRTCRRCKARQSLLMFSEYGRVCASCKVAGYEAAAEHRKAQHRIYQRERGRRLRAENKERREAHA